MSGLSANDKILLTPFQQHYQRGLDYLKDGNAEKAAAKFKQAAIADPEAWCECAHMIGREGHPDMAISALRQVIALHPDMPEVLAVGWCGIGNVLYDLGKTDEAAGAFKASWDSFETTAAAANLALTHLRRRRLDEADAWVKAGLAMNPWSAEAQMVEADINFNRGNYRTAFRQYECRWRSRKHGLSKIPSPKPEWPGPEIRKGTLLVVGEQGLGDIILSLRYAPMIKKLGLRQIWAIALSVKPLAESMGCIDCVIGPDTLANMPDYDFHISGASLPRVFNTSLETIPRKPYLTAWEGCRKDIKRVGLCWRGNPSNPNDKIRSTNLAQWKPILDVPGFKFFSLQVGAGEDEAKEFPQIVTVGRKPESMLETADLVSTMNLVISVDTAMVHLCGAMGIPCWCPLHARPYFVYPMCQEHSPWYPSVRLFKQEREFEWEPVFNQIAQALKNL